MPLRDLTTKSNLKGTTKISEAKRRERLAPRACPKDQASCGTHLGFLTWLAGCAIRSVVQFLGNHTEELSLVFIPIVVGGANADQLEERHSL